jgi:hypothetical protein
MKRHENPSMTDPLARMVGINELIPWDKNPRKNDMAVDAVAESIKRFGFASPILARNEDGRVIAGHTRLKAAKKLGYQQVPVRYLSLNDDEANALALADNKLGELAEWDDEALSDILRDLETKSEPIDNLGWSLEELDKLLEPPKEETETDTESNKDLYTKKIKAPQYEPTGEKPSVDDLIIRSKVDDLIKDIDAASLPNDVASFLRFAAERHTVFNYRKIAEYYCHSSPEIQRLMERSALVIIDFEDAVSNGFVQLSHELAQLTTNEDGHGYE